MSSKLTFLIVDDEQLFNNKLRKIVIIVFTIIFMFALMILTFENPER